MSDNTEDMTINDNADGSMTEEEYADYLFERVDELASAGKPVKLTEYQARLIGIDTRSEPCMSWEDAMDARFDDVAP